MYILGVTSYFHDSSATLLKDGVVIAAAEEERFTRNKHDNGFPENSINFCLEFAGIEMSEIDYIAYYEKPFLKFERLLFQHIDSFPLSFKTFVAGLPSWFKEKLRVIRQFKSKGYKGPVLFVPHHMAHAASTFLPSPFKKAAILTIDGVGEWTTTAFGKGNDRDITLTHQIEFPHSVGLLYSTITAYIGFTVNNAEYKVMGLSPYGNMDRTKNKYYKKLLKVIEIKDDGSYRLDLSYFKYHYTDRMPSEKLETLLGGPILKKGDPLDQRHKDIAAAVQLVTEDVILKTLNFVQAETKEENLVIAGGVALNSVLNGKILKNTKFKKLWIQPNATDGGTSMGAALFVYNSLLKKPRKYELKNAYLGPGYSEKEIKNFIKSNGIIHTKFKDKKELIKTTSKLLREKNVIGWFQGRMEWGPRALGARSILADPTFPEIKDILNLKVKHREKFRPFAPVVPYDEASKYFETDNPIPDSADFMLLVYPIEKSTKKKIPAVVHVDGSGRLQTIKRKDNELYYDLIKEFGKLSGIPILVNTSFNIRGEPIVCSPLDAYRCMMGTEIDYLVMENYLIKRADNPQDMWNSEVNKAD